MKLRTVAIIQARVGSKRFPGKMMANLGGSPLLEWVLHRVLKSSLLNATILATSTNSCDDPLADLAGRLGVPVYRGDEEDVLGRFVEAAKVAEAERVVRVCGDNPFIDAGEIDRLIEFFDETRCDYACNHMDRLGSGYADGFGAEILNVSTLERMAKLTNETRHREHVTLYLWDHAEDFAIKSVPAPVSLAYPHLRFDVDIPSDLAKLDNLVAAGIELTTPASKIVEMALLLNAKNQLAI